MPPRATLAEVRLNRIIAVSTPKFTPKIVVDSGGNMATSNNVTLNAYIATGVSGAYVQLNNSNSGGYSTQLIHSGIHTIFQNGAGGAMYFRTYTANYAAVVGEMILGQEGALYIANRTSVTIFAHSHYQSISKDQMRKYFHFRNLLQ